ncbi:MAG: hypothetical protein ABR581_00105 [Thermoleophilaceae bacterium]
MKRIAAIAATALGLTAAPAYAVNDAFVPAENCAPDNAQAVGHPAAQNEQSSTAGPPFSANNPGNSTGARGQANSEAPSHCG